MVLARSGGSRKKVRERAGAGTPRDMISIMDANEDQAGVQGLIDALRPNPDALFDVLRRSVDESMLAEVSTADYGDYAEDHLEALRAMLHEGKFVVSVPLRGVPREVLELVRWSEPDDPAEKPGSSGIRGHWMRCFACAALLRLGAEPESPGSFWGENQTAAQLASSCLALGPEAAEAGLRFLAWRFGTLPRVQPLNEEDRPFFALALLLLSAHLFAPGDDPRRILELADLVEAEEGRLSACQEEEDRRSERWLLGLTRFTGCHHPWRTLARQVLLAPDRPLPRNLQARLQAIGDRLTATLRR